MENYAPKATDTPLTNMAEKYRQLVGNPRYLEDSTRPDLVYIKRKLAAEIQNTTTRHWSALKETVS